MRAVVLAGLLVPTVASAEDGPPVAGGLEYSFGHGGHVGELALGYRLEPGLFVRVGRWQATLAIPTNPRVESTAPARDTAQLTGVGVGARLAYRAPVFGGVLVVAGGLTRRWMFGEHEVTRTCAQTRACIAGTYVDTPTYHAWAPQVRVGIGGEKLLPTMVLGLSADLIAEAIGFNDVPPDGVRGVTLAGAITFTIGWGPRRGR